MAGKYNLCPCEVPRIAKVEEWEGWRVTFVYCSRCTRRFNVEVFRNGVLVGTGTEGYKMFFYARFPQYRKAGDSKGYSKKFNV